VEIVPISKDCLVCLPKKLNNQLGGIDPLCVVSRIASSVHLIHPSTAQGMFPHILPVNGPFTGLS